jgi:hypothetical protein
VELEAPRDELRMRAATGASLLSRTAASEIADQPWEDHHAMRTGDLPGIDVCYPLLNGIYESLPRQGGPPWRRRTSPLTWACKRRAGRLECGPGDGPFAGSKGVGGIA